MKSPSHRSARRSAGFTLIELLTVIAIIGILAAILIPTVAAVRDKAKKTQCLSNVRQWGQAMMMYASENKQKYVINTAAGGNGEWWYQVGGGNAIYGRYFSMQKDYSSLARCESEVSIPDGLNTTGYTCFLMVRPNLRGTPVALNAVDMTKIMNPASMLLMVERSFTNGGGFVSGDGYQLYITQATARDNANAFTRHNSSMNAVFADGHVASLRATGRTSTSYDGVTGGMLNFQLWTRMD